MTKDIKGAPSRRRVIKAGGALALGLAAPTFLRIGSALAAYPDRPIKIVVANTPGGPSDIMARIIAAEWQQVMGGSAFVENKGGAGGNIGYGLRRVPSRTATPSCSPPAPMWSTRASTIRSPTIRSRISCRSASRRSIRMSSR